MAVTTEGGGERHCHAKKFQSYCQFNPLVDSGYLQGTFHDEIVKRCFISTISEFYSTCMKNWKKIPLSLLSPRSFFFLRFSKKMRLLPLPSLAIFGLEIAGRRIRCFSFLTFTVTSANISLCDWERLVFRCGEKPNFLNPIPFSYFRQSFCLRGPIGMTATEILESLV